MDCCYEFRGAGLGSLGGGCARKSISFRVSLASCLGIYGGLKDGQVLGCVCWGPCGGDISIKTVLLRS